MQKISFKNNLVLIYKDKYEFTYISKSVLYKELFIYSILYLLVAAAIMFLFFWVASFISNIQITYFRAILIPILGVIWFPFLLYNNLHNCVTVAKSDIKKNGSIETKRN